MTNSKSYLKKLAISASGLALTLSLAAIPHIVGAQGAANDPFGVNYGAGTGLGLRDPRETAANIIKIIMGFLGIVSIVIILMGGFKWMTAAGNDEKVGEAKKLIAQGIIGLVIILSAFAITNFVLASLVNATNAGR